MTQWNQHSRTEAGKRYYTKTKLNSIQNDFLNRRPVMGGTPDTIPGTRPKPPELQHIKGSELLHGPSPLESTLAAECHEAVVHFQRNVKSTGVKETYQACAMIFYVYMSHLSVLTVSKQLTGHKHLSGQKGANIESSLIGQVNGAAAMLLHKLATAGWMSSETANKTTLRKYKEGDEMEREIHYMFVLPCVVKLVHTMNPRNYFNINKILDQNIGTWEHSMKKKASTYGVWDRLLIEDKAGRNVISSSDNNMCKGVRFEVAHFLSCTMVNFSNRWNKLESVPLLWEGQINYMDQPMSALAINRVEDRED